jgi:radical SAM protein with 4Fe4S-binding SPASM domain
MIRKAKNVNQTLFPQKLFYGPEWLVLGVNNTCNLHCKMCDVGVDYNESNFFQNLVGTRPLHMPLDLFKKIADQASLYYPKTKLGYAFTEPLVYSQLYESLKYASSKNLFTSITTNALALKKWSDKLVDANLRELNISLDGPADIHNKIRGYSTSFEKAIEGIQYLISLEKRPSISIFCVITEWNIGRLKEFIDYFKKYPLKKIGFMHTNYTPDSIADLHNSQFGSLYHATASNMTDIQLDKYDLNILAEEIKEIKNSSYPFDVVFSPDINSFEELHSFYHQPEKLFGKKCHDIFNAVMIKSNGDVIPAHGRCYNLTIGNLYQQNLKQIWNSRVISKFRKDVSRAGGLLPACSRCCSGFSQ